MCKKNILLITDSYPPEVRSASDLMQDLATGLVDRGFSVTVLTTYPRYNLPDSKKGQACLGITCENGVKVIRIKTLPHHKVNFIIRGISQLTMPFIFILKLLTNSINSIDTVIVYSPPLPLAMVGGFVKYWCKAKFLLNVQDLFPQNAIDLDILRSRIAIHFFELIEKLAYRLADLIFVHSKSNGSFLCDKKKVPEHKVSILHNWIDVRPFFYSSKDHYYRDKLGLGSKMVFLFAGVLGPSQGLDILVNVADAVKDAKDVCFLLVGDGMEKNDLILKIRNKGLGNVIFADFVSKDEYPRLLNSIDVGIVCLSAKNKTPVVPGKILGYMAASKPILAFLNRESDAHDIIREAGCGITSYSDDLDMCIVACKKMIENRDKGSSLGIYGNKFVNKNYERSSCIDWLINNI